MEASRTLAFRQAARRMAGLGLTPSANPQLFPSLTSSNPPAQSILVPTHLTDLGLVSLAHLVLVFTRHSGVHSPSGGDSDQGLGSNLGPQSFQMM